MNKLIVRVLLLGVVILGSFGAQVRAQEGTRLEQAATWLAANNIPATAWGGLAKAKDYQEIEAILAKYGYTEEQLRAFINDMNLLLLDNALNPQPSDDIQVEALTLLQSYGLNGVDLQNLVAQANDPAALTEILMGRGLTNDQATNLLQQAATILEPMKGLMSYYVINTPLFRLIQDAGLPKEMLTDSAYLLDDPEAAGAYLIQIGFSADQVQTFVELIPALRERGLTPDILEGWAVRSLIYSLEGMGLPPEASYDVTAISDSEMRRGYLSARGLSGDGLELALVQIAGIVGYHGEALNPARLQGFQAREASALLESAGIDPADLTILLALVDTPAALRAYLTETYGMDETQIADFEARLQQATFTKTVDPNAAEAFIANVEAIR